MKDLTRSVRKQGNTDTHYERDKRDKSQTAFEGIIIISLSNIVPSPHHITSGKLFKRQTFGWLVSILHLSTWINKKNIYSTC